MQDSGDVAPLAIHTNIGSYMYVLLPEYDIEVPDSWASIGSYNKSVKCVEVPDIKTGLLAAL
jgi:hypothetical protein